MQYLGFLLSLLIGTILGMVGGGGSILTVPLVHYMFGESMLLATTYSLIVVSSASGVGVIQKMRKEEVDIKQGTIFLIPSMLTALAIRAWILPIIPSTFEVAGFSVSRDILIAVLLVLVMLYTGLRTLLSKGRIAKEDTNPIIVVSFGVLTGVLSGFIGAGGGFIIVPILMRLGLPIKKAIGTSMFIIAIQSAFALFGDFLNDEILEAGGINWTLALSLSVLTIGGVFLGNYLQRFFSGKVLRQIFSLILIIVAVGIAYEKLFS